jgi:diguanylate cyclase (GGDEF)-like protein
MGPFFSIQMAYTYLLTFASLVLLLRAFLHSNGLLRRQTGLLLVGILIPMLTSVAVDGFGWNPLPYVDLPALSIVFSVILFGRATLQFNSFYLLPLASDVIIKNMLDGVLVTDEEGVIIFSNPAIQRILAKTEVQLNGLLLDTVLSAWLPEAQRAWKEGKDHVQLITTGGDAQYFQLAISKITGYSNESIGTLLKLNNNTEQKDYEARLNELAISDPLTGSYNRRYFYEMAYTYYEQMQRSGRPLSLLMIDLDHFKGINDTYGHTRGDLVLQKVAAICKNLVRTQDIFSRYGGEEFILAMPETTLANALVVAERLRNAIEALKNEVEDIPVTASIGVVETAGEVNLTLDGLLNRVDEAMYSSKHAGRNRVTVWKASKE